MADPAPDYLADLTTAPIFDEDVYRSEALNLPESETEDQLDAQLALEARNAGIQDPDHFLYPDVHDISTAVSTMTVSSAPRSSMSIHSRETQSTGITSHPSRTSRDYPYVESAPALRPGLLPRMSMSSDDYYDSMMGRFRSNARHRASHSLSGPSSLAPPKPATPRKHKRSSGYGLFSMFRRDSSTCTSSSPHGHHSKSTSPKLECGHSLSKYSIRVHIQEALQSKDQLPPKCCGKPLPVCVLETVLTKDEIDLVTPKGSSSPATDSGYSEDGMSSIDIPRPVRSSAPLTQSVVKAMDTSSQDRARKEDEQILQKALADESFQKLKAEQKEQFRQICSFETNQRKALSAYHEWSLKRLTSQWETNKSEKTKQVRTRIMRPI